MNDASPEKWAIDPHTRAKHQILDSYLKGWFPKLTSFREKVIYLDGFAGRGRYTDGTEGSPLIALRALVDHQHLGRMSHCKFIFWFIEANKDNEAALRGELTSFIAEHDDEAGPEIGIDLTQNTFEKTGRKLAESLEAKGAKIAPTFAFIDPFGYTGLPMDLIKSLFGNSQSEVLVNFMVGSVQRFIERDGQEAAIESLFGLPASDVMAGKLTDAKRVEHLRDVYMRQLRDVGGFEYVRSFAMTNFTGNVSYYLVHGTHHREGVKLMKAAMWKADPGGGTTFQDRLHGVEVLFDAEPDTAPLRAELLSYFAERHEVPIDEIEWHTVLNTPYRETHVRPILTALEKDGTINVRRNATRGFPKDRAWIDFPAI
ncbi:three-Cys-motif partner protein TcmP [Microbacterium sp. Leaf320]|uniref:three-Cys-motif partner protein TcmP n=1 Tax=Microbacterium sp. Leaf320 TaxID=1736334 RepID=UPI0006FB7611|nr:three-Cys-motif partner protein TcmP [Microbacterium sp. Leaf320]KQQ65406.1 hypothetical protein ASF63_15840 [Microbacterium sp. Leaf320]